MLNNDLTINFSSSFFNPEMNGVAYLKYDFYLFIYFNVSLLIFFNYTFDLILMVKFGKNSQKNV